jgi:hypothetical protein
MKNEIALLIGMPEHEVEEKLEEGEYLAVKVEILRVFEHDELFAQQVGILLPEGGTPSSAAAAERMLKGAVASIEEALKRLHAYPEEGFVTVQMEGVVLH